LVILTGDHGCDPTTPPTDHSRERTPLLVAGCSRGPYDLGTRSSFADLGATVLQALGVAAPLAIGESFAGAGGVGGSSDPTSERCPAGAGIVLPARAGIGPGTASAEGGWWASGGSRSAARSTSPGRCWSA